MFDRFRLVLLVILSVFYLGAGFALSRSLPMGSEPKAHLYLYLSLGLLCPAIYLCLRKMGDRRATFYLLTMSIILGGFFLDAPPSDDVNRYLWEGAAIRCGINPYLSSPLDSREAILEQIPWLASVYPGINHKDKTAIYGPVFLLITAVCQGPWALIQYRLILLAIGVALFLLLARWLGRLGLPISTLAFLFLNPLYVVYVQGEAHNDLFQILPLAGALFCWERNRYRSFLFLLGLSICTKFTSILFLPLAMRRYHLKYGLYLILPFAFYLIFWRSHFHPFHSFFYFANEMSFNNPYFLAMEALFGSWTRLFLAGSLAVSCFILPLYTLDSKRSVFLCYYLFLLMAPTVHSWYLVLLLTFNVFFLSLSVYGWSLLPVFLIPHYHFYLATGQWAEKPSLLSAILLGLFILVDGARFYFRTLYRRRRPLHSPRVAAVIPVLDEEKRIGTLLSRLKLFPDLNEIVCVDGGSADRTPDIILEAGVSLIQTGGGRGQQIRRGIETCQSEVIAVIHADHHVDKGIIQQIKTVFRADDRVVMGAFSVRFKNERKSHLGFIHHLNDFRARFLGISFGDQIQFFRKDVLDEIGGYPALALMEDVELCLRMKKVGKTAFLGTGGSVSNRRWSQNGIVKNAFRILFLFHDYLFRRFWVKAPDDRDFYRKYYRRKAPLQRI